MVRGRYAVAVIRSCSWRNQYACRDADLFIDHRIPRIVVEGRFAKRAMDCFIHLRTYVQDDPHQCRMLAFRTYGEQGYFAQLSAIPSATIEGWRGRNIVSSHAFPLSHPLLLAKFLYRK